MKLTKRLTGYDCQRPLHLWNRLGQLCWLSLTGSNPEHVFRLPRNRAANPMDHDAATLAGNHGAVAFRKNLRQRPSLLGSQPQTQQVALALRLGPILEGGPVVQ